MVKFRDLNMRACDVNMPASQTKVIMPMSCPNFHSSAPILLVGAGPALQKTVKEAFAHCDFIIAADGGARWVADSGLPIRAIIGDGDSLGDPSGGGDLFLSRDQDTTDFQKCLAAIDAPLILGVGFLGGRLDHQLAVFSAMLKDPRPIIVLDHAELAFIVPPRWGCDLPSGTAISFYPLRPVRASTGGVAYPVCDAHLRPDGLISTSNTVTGRVTVQTDQRGLLCSLPVDHLPAIIASFPYHKSVLTIIQDCDSISPS